MPSHDRCGYGCPGYRRRRPLARAVAVLGDGADGSHAAALAALERRSLAPAAAALARVGLLQAEPPLRFVHPLVRNAVYESIGAHERALEHARAAAVLTSADAAAEEVAGQLLLAPSQSVDGAVAPLREAAGRAAAEGAPDSAARYLRRALEEPIPDDERGALLLELAAVELNLGAATIIDGLQEAVRLVGDPERRAQARLELGRALYWAGHEEDAIDVLEQALAERDCEDDLQRRLQAELFANATRLPSVTRAHAGDSIRSRCGPRKGREPGCCSGCRPTTRRRAAGAASGRSSVPSWRLLR